MVTNCDTLKTPPTDEPHLVCSSGKDVSCAYGYSGPEAWFLFIDLRIVTNRYTAFSFMILCTVEAHDNERILRVAVIKAIYYSLALKFLKTEGARRSSLECLKLCCEAQGWELHS